MPSRPPALDRPHPNLLRVYLLRALLANVAFPFVALPLFFKYKTLKYALDDEGVSASWGVLFRREVYLSYRRIQDIHVRRDLFERWLGIGTVEIQTASGSAKAELALEGLERYEEVRDFLYGRMRGLEPTEDEAPAAPAAAASGEDVVALLRAIRDELRAARAALEARAS